MYIAEKLAGGAPIDVTEVTVKLMKGEQNAPAHRARTPFASVPVLEIDDGDFIIESLTIMEYLEERYPTPVMVGRGLRERARVRELERIADLRVLTPIARAVHATKSPLGLPPSADIADQGRASARQGLTYLDALLADGRPFIAGDGVTFADCTLAAALQFARFGEFPLDTAFANVFAWDARYRQRPAAQAVLSL